MKIYISFGEKHRHTINGVGIGGTDSMLCICGVSSENQARAIIYAIIGDAWCGTYTVEAYSKMKFKPSRIHILDITPKILPIDIQA